MKRDELDRLLDDGLAGYASAEPRPGLEQRVLARVRAEGHARPFGWFVWAAAVAATIVLVAVQIVDFHAKPEPVSAPSPVRYATPLMAATPRVVSRRVGHTPHRNPRPKRDQFPLPVAPTPEERALSDFALRFPERAKAELADVNAPIQPVDIEPIQIEPLPDGGSEQ